VEPQQHSIANAIKERLLAASAAGTQGLYVWFHKNGVETDRPTLASLNPRTVAPGTHRNPASAARVILQRFGT